MNFYWMKVINKYLTLLLSFVCFLCACKKADITHVDLKGKVMNNATGEPFEGIEVFLVIQKDKFLLNKGSEEQLSTYSQKDGTFTFPKLKINESKLYHYYLIINTNTGKDFYIEGVTGEINKANVFNEHVLGVYPCMKRLSIKPPKNIVVNYPVDSFVVTFEQKDVLKRLPNKNAKYVMCAYYWYNWNADNVTTSGPMGKWYITTEQYKGGTYNVVKDSVYMKWGESRDYFIPW